MQENLTFDQLPQAVTLLIKDISELKTLLLKKSNNQSNQETEKFLNIQEAAKLLNLTVATCYSKVSKNELPCMKRGKRLYFSSIELTKYLKEGRKKSNVEIEQEADAYLSNNKKGLNNE